MPAIQIYRDSTPAASQPPAPAASQPPAPAASQPPLPLPPPRSSDDNVGSVSEAVVGCATSSAAARDDKAALCKARAALSVLHEAQRCLADQRQRGTAPPLPPPAPRQQLQRPPAAAAAAASSASRSGGDASAAWIFHDNPMLGQDVRRKIKAAATSAGGGGGGGRVEALLEAKDERSGALRLILGEVGVWFSSAAAVV